MTPLYAAELGAGDVSVVLLHGFAGCHGVWDDIAFSLARSARTLAYDLPGHGGSLDFPGAGPARIAARAVLADMAARNVGKAHVVGHSMGGAVAVLMARSEPECIASLTLLAPGSFGEAIDSVLLARYAAATSGDEIGAAIAAMSGPDGRGSGRNLDAYIEMRSIPGQTAKLAEIAALISKDGRQGVIPRELLKTLPMPVSVAWGEKDMVLPVTQMQDLPPGFNLCLVPRAGHMLVSEVPELVLDLIRQSIDGKAAAEPAGAF